MSYRLRITQSAEADIRHNHRWWAKHRSEEQADRWLIGIDRLLSSLAVTAERHAGATEALLLESGIKQVSFGLGPHQTHRVIYTIRGDEVVIYRVRAFKQDALGAGDLQVQSPTD